MIRSVVCIELTVMSVGNVNVCQDGSGDIDRAEVMLLLQDLGLQVRLHYYSLEGRLFM